MKKMIIFAMCLALAACDKGPQGIPTSPAEVADMTKVDEQAALGAEVLYTTATTFGDTLSRTGVIDRARFQALDAQAYGYLLVVRQAYQTGNSANFVSAVANLNATVAKIRDLKGK